MSKRILYGAVLLFPLLTVADTLTMKDGRSFRGNFNNANTTQMTFTEYNGNPRTVNIYDVQELRFGNDQQQFSSSDDKDAYRGSGNYGNAPGGNPAIGDDLDRLRQDLRVAMDNNGLAQDRRQSLDDARETLRVASDRSRSGRAVDQRTIRLALDSIRNSTDRMQRQDRDRLNDDIRRLSASMGGQQGRDY